MKIALALTLVFAFGVGTLPRTAEATCNGCSNCPANCACICDHCFCPLPAPNDV